MADIDIQCPDCKTITTISEFAEIDSIPCKSCGRSIERPVGANSPQTKKGLRLRKPTPSPEAPETPEAQEYLKTIKPPKQKKRVSTWRISQHVAAWITFIVLGTAMWFCRYGNVLTGSQLKMLKDFAPLVLLAFHILILLKAFQDSIFQGILCLMIPGYSLVYLFFVTDDFYARATVAGLLVGIGEDSFYYYQDKVFAVYEAVTAWLARGA